jgi:hypothetical protein
MELAEVVVVVVTEGRRDAASVGVLLKAEGGSACKEFAVAIVAIGVGGGRRTGVLLALLTKLLLLLKCESEAGVALLLFIAFKGEAGNFVFDGVVREICFGEETDVAD